VCLLPGGAGWAGRADLPPSLAGLARDGIAGLGTAVGSHDPGHEEQALAEAAASGTLPGFPASWRARYPACDPSGWLTHGGYVRALEALADDFLAARGLLAGRLLAERGWVPAFSRARVRLLGETAVDETVQAVYSVAQVVRNSLFDGRAECHVRRGDRYVPTATAILLHGYALAAGPRPGRIVELDAAAIAAVTGQEP
jgi:acyl-CoA thioesterase FadM